MPDKIKGTVKWFSNRKGFGFITPTSDNSPTKEDIFVHQSNIVTEAEAYRTLKDGFEVEFEAVFDDSGKLKAQNVTSADGTPCPGPEPEKRRRKKKEGAAAKGGSGDEAGGETAGEKSDDGGAEKKNGRRRKKGGKEVKEGGDAEKPKSWYASLDETVRKSLEGRDVKVDGGRAFLSIGDCRLKLGTGGYAAMAHTSGLLAEGTYTCDKDGKVAITWTHVLKSEDAGWKVSTADAEKASLIAEINLTDESVKPTGNTETPETLWGEGKGDPKDALEANGFQMRKLVLHATPGGGRRRGRGRRGKNGQKGGETKAKASTE